MEGNKEKILPQAKKHRPDNTTNHTGRPMSLQQRKYRDASITKAINMAFSRPIWSETQPQRGRVKPFTMRFNCDRQNQRGHAPGHDDFIHFVEAAIGLSCEVTTRPPKANMSS